MWVVSLFPGLKHTFLVPASFSKAVNFIFTTSLLAADSVLRNLQRVKKSVECREVVPIYNNGMKGVDYFDQLISYFAMLIRSRKYWKRIALRLVDMLILNCFIAYKERWNAKFVFSLLITTPPPSPLLLFFNI
jgi:hypothetical protein